MALFTRFLRHVVFCTASVTGAALADSAVTSPSLMTPDTPFSASVQQLLNSVQSAVVEIRNCPALATTPDCTPDTQIGFSSGVLISASGEVLTTYDVIRKVARLVVVTADGHRHPDTVVGCDELLRLALPRFPEVITPSVFLVPGVPEVGTPVLTQRTGKVMTVGLVSNVLEISASELQLNVAIKRSGAERGGAVFNL